MAAPPTVRPVACWIIVPLELVVHSEQDRNREAVPQGVFLLCRGGQHEERHCFGSGDIHPVARLETRGDFGIGGVE